MAALQYIGRTIKLGVCGLGRAYNDSAKKRPLGVGIVTTVLKTSAADLFAQKIVEQREEVDWRRHGMFCLFGFAYLGCWQYYLYNKLFVTITPAVTRLFGHRVAAPVMTFLDQGIHHPLLYFPAFYTLKGTIEGRPVFKSLTNCQRDMWPNLKALWSIWVPAQLVNFSVVPLHLRVPFVAGVSFAWCIVLSVLRGALEKPAVATTTSAATAAVATAAA